MPESPVLQEAFAEQHQQKQAGCEGNEPAGAARPWLFFQEHPAGESRFHNAAVARKPE